MTSMGHNGGPPLTEGYVKIYRSMATHWLVGMGLGSPRCKPPAPSRKQFSYYEAWSWILNEANYGDGVIRDPATGRPVRLLRSELLGGHSAIAAAWNWSPKAVRNFLDKLEAAGMIEMPNRLICNGIATGNVTEATKVSSSQGRKSGNRKGTFKGNHTAIIRVRNYSTYQGEPELRGNQEGNQRGRRGATEGQLYKRQRRKRKKRNNRIFWSFY